MLNVSSIAIHQTLSIPLQIQCCSSNSHLAFPRGRTGKSFVRCSNEIPISNNGITKQLVSGFAASLIFYAQTNQVVALDLSQPNNICSIAAATDKPLTLPLDEGSDGKLMAMRGMTAKNFDPARYAGRWFEVASLKSGFAGQGQEDCHCTQLSGDAIIFIACNRYSNEGDKFSFTYWERTKTYICHRGVYTYDMEAPAIQVDTFCVHGSPDGYITGIRGRVQCVPEEDLKGNETDLEKQAMIIEKCYLRFPTLPFIPKEPYDVIATDYDNFALVSGAKDKSFVQIYSRQPNPGRAFIDKYKDYLANFGYDPSKIKDTPQDCEGMSDSKLTAMMSMSGMQKALTNEFPDLELKSSVQFNPFTSVFDTLKKLIQLYFK
ncbi:hypothetical protein ACFE04_007528 [Oxalis oulophora]